MSQDIIRQFDQVSQHFNWSWLLVYLMFLVVGFLLLCQSV